MTVSYTLITDHTGRNYWIWWWWWWWWWCSCWMRCSGKRSSLRGQCRGFEGSSVFWRWRTYGLRLSASTGQGHR